MGKFLIAVAAPLPVFSRRGECPAHWYRHSQRAACWKTLLIARLAYTDRADIAAGFAAGEIGLDGEREIAVDRADVGFSVQAEGGVGRQRDGDRACIGCHLIGAAGVERAGE